MKTNRDIQSVYDFNILILLVIASSTLGGCSVDRERFDELPLTREGLDSTIFVLFDIGQSNSIGRATSDRLIEISNEVRSPKNVLVFFRATNSGKGSFVQLVEGSENTVERGAVSYGTSGAYGMLARRMSQISPNPVYVVAAGDGGTALQKNLTTPDWYPDSAGEAFDTSLKDYYLPALEELRERYPNFRFRTIVCWHQGESDALDESATNEYPENFKYFVSRLRRSHATLQNSLLIITKLHFNGGPNEESINAFFDAYAQEDSSHVKLVDISDMPRKDELTLAQRGGIPTAGFDDRHTSYLGMRKKAIESFRLVRKHYLPFLADSID